MPAARDSFNQYLLATLDTTGMIRTFTRAGNTLTAYKTHSLGTQPADAKMIFIDGVIFATTATPFQIVRIDPVTNLVLTTSAFTGYMVAGVCNAGLLVRSTTGDTYQVINPIDLSVISGPYQGNNGSILVALKDMANYAPGNLDNTKFLNNTTNAIEVDFSSVITNGGGTGYEITQTSSITQLSTLMNQVVVNDADDPNKYKYQAANSDRLYYGTINPGTYGTYDTLTWPGVNPHGPIWTVTTNNSIITLGGFITGNKRKLYEAGSMGAASIVELIVPSETDIFNVRSLWVDIDSLDTPLSGNVVMPMFETAGTIAQGGLASGNIIMPMFKTVGTILKGISGDITFPLFKTAGIILPDSPLSGSITFPMFETSGFITDNSRIVATTDLEIWVLNADSDHHSQYENWQINSFGRFNGQDIAAMPGGIYLLTGDDDAGATIEASIFWPACDLTSRQMKVLEAAFIRMRGNCNDISFVVVIDEDEEVIFNVSLTRTKEGNMVARVPMPRGFQGQLYKFGIRFEGEGKIEFFEVEIDSRELKRKLK